MKTNRFCNRVRLTAVVMLLALTSFVTGAHVLEDLDINVVITKSGDFVITETRIMKIRSDGTEGYIKVYNLPKHSVVKDIRVTDETGVTYTVDDDWDTDASRDYKRNKCGILKVDAGYEVCWGIGNAGNRTYYVTYTVTNGLRAYKESDGFNFIFYETGSPVARHAKVTLRHEDATPINRKNARIWAFQYEGSVFFKDSCIVAETTPDQRAKFNQGIIICAEFEKGLFSPAETESKAFRDVKEKAFEGSDYNINDSVGATGKSSYAAGGDYTPYEKPWYKDLYDELKGYLWLGLGLLGLWGGASANVGRINRREKKRLFGNTKCDIDVWSRELPYNGDLSHTNGVLKMFDKKARDNHNLIHAYIMRMLYMKLISIQPSADGSSSELYITPPAAACPYNDASGAFMYELQKLMFAAAGDDHKLQPDEMANYVKVNPVSHREQINLMQSLLDSTAPGSLKQLTRDDVVQVFGLKKFLQEFTLSNERTMGEVALWREYLVHATVFGIAKQVRKDMLATWPEVNRIEGLTMQMSEQVDTFADTITYSTLGAMTYVRDYETPEERRARERSEGSGGSSSWGGGGGASGGGGSGVR